MARIIGAMMVGAFGGMILVLVALSSLGVFRIETQPLIIVPVLDARPAPPPPEPTQTPAIPPTRTPEEYEEGRRDVGVREAEIAQEHAETAAPSAQIHG